MKKSLLIILMLIFSILMCNAEERYVIAAMPVEETQGQNNKNIDYVLYIKNMQNKDLAIHYRLEACENIRKLPDSVPLTKAQLYALKIAARYKIYDIWARTKIYSPYEDLKIKASNILAEGNYFYSNRVQTAGSYEDLHTNMFFLGLYEYVLGNKNIGTQTMNEELTYFKGKSNKQYVLLSQIYDLTLAICNENKSVEEILNIIKNINY